MRLALPCALLALAAPPALAQTGTISGTIVNAATHAPIEGATVSVNGTVFASSTHEHGAFTIVGVPAGVYIVAARRAGFATHELGSVEVEIGRVRTITIELRAATTDTTNITERTEFVPAFIDPTIGRNAVSLSHAQISSAPSLTTVGALAENGGYLALPKSSAVQTLEDLRRGVTSLASVRGARPDATQYLLDGMPVNNPVFGSPPLLIEPLTTAGVTFSPAHVDAEHGGTLSGLVEQAIRGGSSRVNGAIEFQSGALAGGLGSPVTAASATYAGRGYISGPLPLADGKLRFSIGGHVLGEQLTVSKSADSVWRGSHGNQDDQFVGKLTYALRPTLQLSLSGVDQRRYVADVDPGVFSGDTIAPPSVNDHADFIMARVDKRFARTNLSLSLSENSDERQTCSTWQGVCVEGRFQRIPQGSEIPAFGPPPRETEYAATGQYFGGESYHTHAARADLVSQITDHHQIGAGMFVARHDLAYRGITGLRWVQGLIITSTDSYRAHPTEVASYFEDAIQYDLITVHLGARFDWGSLGGIGFTNPRDPTNGTTAREVCDGTARGFTNAPFTSGQFSGIAACMNSPIDAAGRPVLFDSATRLAQRDDYHAVHPRATFSPRIAVSFPLTETSGLYINAGRYSKEPLYNDAYRNTGTGSRAGIGHGGDGMCEARLARPGSNECVPSFGMSDSLPEFIGNPDLAFEVSDAFEAGFRMQAGRTHSLDVSVFSNEESYVPTVFVSALTPDPGLTYGATNRGAGRTVQSTGSIYSTGVSVTLRRRLEHTFSYSMSYTWERSTEIGAPPDLVVEALAVGETFDNSRERFTSRIPEHTFNVMLSWQWRQEGPNVFGPALAAALRNTHIVSAVGIASRSREADSSTFGCPPAQACSPAAGSIGATGLLVNLLYVRTLAGPGARFAIIARVHNLLNARDGTETIFGSDARRLAATIFERNHPVAQLGLRRVLLGMSVDF